MIDVLIWLLKLARSWLDVAIAWFEFAQVVDAIGKPPTVFHMKTPVDPEVLADIKRKLAEQNRPAGRTLMVDIDDINRTLENALNPKNRGPRD